MNHALQQKIEKELLRAIHADRCSICQRPFERDDRTYGGIVRSGAAAYTGDCCVAQITELFVFGCKIE
jgi:hypothetical protein